MIAARTPTRRLLVVEGVSVGFHALARAGYKGRNSADVGSAVRAGVSAVARFQPLTVGIEADGEFQVLRIGQLFAANLPFFGPGLHVAPGADPGRRPARPRRDRRRRAQVADPAGLPPTPRRPPRAPRRHPRRCLPRTNRDRRPLADHRRHHQPGRRDGRADRRPRRPGNRRRRAVSSLAVALDAGRPRRLSVPFIVAFAAAAARRRSRSRSHHDLPAAAPRPDCRRARPDRHGHARQRGRRDVRPARDRDLERPARP